MKVAYFTIAGGNKTALVSDYLEDSKYQEACLLLPHVEQIGFIENKEESRLCMFGGELCVNALLALASQLKNSEGTLHTDSGTSINYKNFPTKTQITIHLPYSITNNIVLFEGIGFIFFKDKKTILKSTLASYAKKYNLPAFGAITYTETTEIEPQVYIVKTDTMINETACGSGSIATRIITGHTNIIQPTGEVIEVNQEGDIFTVEASVEKLK